MKTICHSAAVLAAAAFALCVSIQGASAQTATNLKCKGCVQSKDIAKGAVTKDKIQSNTINADKLAHNAKPAGVDYKIYYGVTPIDTTEKTYAKVVLNVPTTGYVHATVSGNILFDAHTTVDCYFDDGSGRGINLEGSSSDGLGGRQAFSQTHVIRLLNPGKNTIRWKCALRDASDTRFNGYEISALFVPNRY